MRREHNETASASVSERPLLDKIKDTSSYDHRAHCSLAQLPGAHISSNKNTDLYRDDISKSSTSSLRQRTGAALSGQRLVLSH